MEAFLFLCHDVDQMYGTKGLMRISVYPGKAYIEIKGQLYNRTSLPQTFLWWANPAVPVNDNTQSIFPPDVHAVMVMESEMFLVSQLRQVFIIRRITAKA